MSIGLAFASFFSDSFLAVSFSGTLELAVELAEVLPSKISIKLRLIALHIICVSSSPLAPTIPPTATSKRSLIARPAMAPATPDKLFNKDIVMGISAPPTLMLNNIPNKPETKKFSATKIQI